MSGDQFYVDVDPIALRFIYNILHGIVQTSDLHNLSSMEIILIKNSAQYLLCPDVAQIVDTTKNELDIQIAESTKKDIDFLKEENLRLKIVAATQEVLEIIKEQLYQGFYRELVLMTKKKVILERKIRE